MDTVGIVQISSELGFYFKEFSHEELGSSFVMDVQSLSQLIQGLNLISKDSPTVKLEIAGRTLLNQKTSLFALELVPYHWKKRVVFRFREPYRNWSFALKSQKHTQVFVKFLSMIEKKINTTRVNAQEASKNA